MEFPNNSVCVLCCWIHMFQFVAHIVGFTGVTCSCWWAVFRAVGFTCFSLCFVLMDSHVPVRDSCCWIHIWHVLVLLGSHVSLFVLCRCFQMCHNENLDIRYDDNKATMCYIITQKAIRPSPVPPSSSSSSAQTKHHSLLVDNREEISHETSITLSLAWLWELGQSPFNHYTRSADSYHSKHTKYVNSALLYCRPRQRGLSTRYVPILITHNLRNMTICW